MTYPFDPTLKNKTYGYSFVWSSIGIRDRYITTDKEILKVRQNLQGFIHNDANHLKYLVFNLNDPFFGDMAGITNTDLLNGVACQKFDPKLTEVQQFDYTIAETGWPSTFVVCEVNRTTG